MKVRILLYSGYLAFLSFLILACDEDTLVKDSKQHEKDIPKVRIHLIDKPAEQFDAVYVDIREVVILHSGSDEWVPVTEADNPPGVVNLLELTNGKSRILGEKDIEAESIAELRLILGENNSLVIDGKPLELQTPSAQQSGLKVKLNEHLKSGLNDITIDFDVAESIIKAGNSGTYILKPVIRPIRKEGYGSIQGKVEPEGTQALIRMSVGTKSYNTFLDESGRFTILGLPAGIYELTVYPKHQKKISISGIEIRKNEITNFGSLTLAGK